MKGKWVDTPIGRIFVPDGWKLWISKPWITNVKGPDPRKLVGYKVTVSPPRDPRKTWKRAKRRHRRMSVQNFVGYFSRYRERDLDSGTFLIGRHDQQITHSSILGRTYNVLNNKTVSSVTMITGANLKPSINMEKTWDNTNQGPPYRGGGPFRNLVCHLPQSAKVGTGTFNNLGSSGTNQSSYGVYEGSFVDDGEWRAGPSYESIRDRSFSTFTNLSPFHTLAWDKCKPQVPKGNLSQFLYELRDLPGQLKTTASALHLRWADLSRGQGERGFMLPYMQPREVADHFINHEFGWKPFISDIVKLIDVFNHTEKHISDLVRDNGIYIRKRRVLDESESVSSFTWLPQSATVPGSSSLVDPNGRLMCRIQSTPVGSGTGLTTFTTRTRKRVWAVGSFKYYRPEFDERLFDGNSFDLFMSLRRLMTIYGLRLSPTLIYKLTPWTWLVDWFTNFGNHLQRLDDFVIDGIVARYLYIMNHEETEVTKSCTLNFFSGPITVQFQRRFSLKQREVADTPYGFASPWNSLSPRQWGILGALGFTRVSNGFISRGA